MNVIAIGDEDDSPTDLYGVNSLHGIAAAAESPPIRALPVANYVPPDKYTMNGDMTDLICHKMQI